MTRDVNISGYGERHKFSLSISDVRSEALPKHLPFPSTDDTVL